MPEMKPKKAGTVEEEPIIKRDLSKRQDSHTMIQKIMEKEKKM